MFDRWIEKELVNVLDDEGVGCIVFSPLAQGVLTNKYLNGIPADSRAGKPVTYLKPEQITDTKLAKVEKLNQIALELNLSLAQLAIKWTLRNRVVTSSLIGASRPSQIEEIVAGVNKPALSVETLKQIENILAE